MEDMYYLDLRDDLIWLIKDRNGNRFTAGRAARDAAWGAASIGAWETARDGQIDKLLTYFEN